MIVHKRHHMPREALLASNRESQRRRNKRLRLAAFSHYGGAKCKRCGFDDERALTIDHVKQDGNKHLRPNGVRYGGASLYNWLNQNHYPAGFRVLCANCQFIVYKEHTKCV
jgi:hypothetical protein